jgi:hypothetical protein
VAALATRRGARALAQAFGGLARLPRDKRETRLARWLDDRFDVTAARARLPVLLRETRALRIAANVLWAGLFVGLPALLWTPYVHLLLLPVGAVSVVAWIVAAALFVRALRLSSWLDRALRPDLANASPPIASPLATIRAADHIARELCGDLDPLAVRGGVAAAGRRAAAGAVVAVRPALPRSRRRPGRQRGRRALAARRNPGARRARAARVRHRPAGAAGAARPRRRDGRVVPRLPGAVPRGRRAARDVRQRAVPRESRCAGSRTPRRPATPRRAERLSRRHKGNAPGRLSSAGAFCRSARGLVGGERRWAPPSSKTQCEPR